MLLLYASAWIPKEAFRENLLLSAEYLEEKEDEFHCLQKGNPATEIDNYADAILFNIMYSIEEKHKAVTLIEAPFYSDRGNEEYPMLRLLKERIAEEKEPDTVYDRYWHGMMIFLRPLFVFFTIKGIRVFAGILMVLLMGLLTAALVKRGQKALAASLWIAGFFVCMPMTVMCVEYMPTWFITLAVSLAACKLWKKRETVLCLLVISGVCCGFFDFLTTETVTFAVPCAIVLCIWQKEGRLKGIRKETGFLFAGGMLWSISYLAVFLVKWMLSGAVFEADRAASAIEIMLFRQGGDFTVPEAVLSNIRLLAGFQWIATKEGLCLALLALGAGAAAFLFLYGKREGNELSVLLFLLAAVPVIRIALLHGHSGQHYFFTYRALFASIVCVITAMGKAVDVSLLKKDFRLKGQGGRR